MRQLRQPYIQLLLRPFLSQNSKYSHKQYLDVKSQRPVVDVGKVQLHNLLKILYIASATCLSVRA